MSYAKVRALTRVAEPESEADLLELAVVLTASRLERAIRAYRRVTAAEAREPYERAHLDVYWDEDGSLVVRGRLAPEDGATLERALAAAADRLWAKKDDGSAEPRASKAEALVAFAETSLGGGAGPRASDLYQDGRPAPSPPRCAGPSLPATAAGASLAVRTGLSMRTTSSTGHGAARPAWTTSSCYAGATTGLCTRAVTASTGGCASTTREAG
jgi:hypothetical protein